MRLSTAFVSGAMLNLAFQLQYESLFLSVVVMVVIPLFGIEARHETIF